jgi:hypothetical protein
VFYQVLIRLDADQLPDVLSDWLQTQSGMLPSALALDGKMIRHCIGTVTLAEHEDGSPVALAIMDHKEGTPRCEQRAAASLLESLPALDGKVVSADALHCQKRTARTIVEKGGDYLLQIKADQPALLRQAQAASAVSTDTGHGRLEERSARLAPVEPMAVDFPFARSILITATPAGPRRGARREVDKSQGRYRRVRYTGTSPRPTGFASHLTPRNLPLSLFPDEIR